MAIQQDGEAGKPSAPEQVPAEISAKGLSRRRFGKAGLGASGVLLTLASQPGMACDICVAPSGSLSGGLKSHHGPAPVCSGLSPGYWKTHSSWPSGCSPSYRFNSVFTCTGANRNTFGSSGCTFGTILSHQSYDTCNLGMHLMATYLNIKSGKISFLTKTQLQTIWSEWQSKGCYSPITGVNWDANRIVLYLTGTMD